MKQLELFDNLEKSDKIKALKRETRDIKQLWRFKRWLFLIIYTIVVLIIGFSLGAEKGKGGVKTTKIQRVSRKAPKEISGKRDKKIAPETKRASVDTGYKYAIQVSTFKNLHSAETEKKTLEKAGLRVFLAKSGKFTRVLIGPFKAKKEAENNLKTIRKKYSKRYPDCFVKKIE